MSLDWLLTLTYWPHELRLSVHFTWVVSWAPKATQPKLILSYVLKPLFLLEAQLEGGCLINQLQT